MPILRITKSIKNILIKEYNQGNTPYIFLKGGMSIDNPIKSPHTPMKEAALFGPANPEPLMELTSDINPKGYIARNKIIKHIGKIKYIKAAVLPNKLFNLFIPLHPFYILIYYCN
jgi:hypothetical protein